MRRLAVLLLLGVRIEPAEAELTDGERFYLAEVRPLLAAKCLACHGDEAKKIKGEFDMRTREGLIKGGESGGAAVVPGKPDESPLYLAVRWEDDLLEMPPKENDRLDAGQVATIRRWIEMGAPWSAAAAPAAGQREDSGERTLRVATSGGLSDDWTNRRYRTEDLWAYQPVREREVPVVEGVSHPIDAFVAFRLAEAGLQAAERADRRTLVRRATYNLTGLPPGAEALGSKARWEVVIDGLLESPRYGEHMAQHWLDVVRYADTAGFANDWERPHAWRYRDYVIRAFNTDKRFDRFVREQIAGDELAPDDSEARVATGYLRMGPWEHTAMSVAAVTRQQFLDDVTNSVGESFLAQGLRCASCHDHKFDPIPTRDYYRMQAIFGSTQFDEPATPFQDWESGEFEARRKQVERIAALGPEPITKLDGEDSFGRINEKRAASLERARLRFAPKSFSVTSTGSGRTRILTGGALDSPGEEVAPGVLSVTDFQVSIPSTPHGRRLALADWIADERNPLTARVVVNRVWQWHFGTGLATASNNFGKMGGAPSHPELLDWLASWFVENGWSIKKLHRLIMTSETWQRSGFAPDPAQAGQVDPDNRLLSWFPPRRLTAEEIRDSTLLVSGELDLTMGGPGVFPVINREVALQPRHIMGGIAMAYQASPTRSLRNRRSIYVFRTRTLANPVMEVFNKPGPDLSCEKRDETIVTPQVFALFNSETARDRAVAFAHRVAGSRRDPGRQVEEAFLLAYGREPTSGQRAAALDHLNHLTAEHERGKIEIAEPVTAVRREMVAEQSGELFAWKERLVTEDIEPDLKLHDLPAGTRALAELCLVLFNSSEFLYVY